MAKYFRLDLYFGTGISHRLSIRENQPSQLVSLPLQLRQKMMYEMKERYGEAL